MGERGRTYDDVVTMVTNHFETAVSAAGEVVARAGGRFLSRDTLDACMREAIKEVVAATSDLALLAVVSTRPWLLHHDPEATGRLASPREALDQSLSAALSKDLAEVRLARLADGQDAETLPEAAAAALAALTEVEAGGKRFRDAEDARRVLGAGDWDDCLVYGIGMPLADFLSANGRPGAGNDLRAAIGAREAVMECGSGPTPR